VLLCLGSSPHLNAQTLEDSIDAELDDASLEPPPSAQGSGQGAGQTATAPTTAPGADKGGGADPGTEALTSEELTEPAPESGVATEPEIQAKPPVKAKSVTKSKKAKIAIPADAPAASSQASDSVFSSSSNPGDEPNLRFEKRMHDIFAHAAPVSDEKWSEMLGARKEEVYGVQAGDTLWDISTTLFGDGMFWSKLWAENGSIENPHLIAPGKGIRFIAGNESEAPSLRVTETAVVATEEKVALAEKPLEGKPGPVEVTPDAPAYDDQAAAITESSTPGEIDESAIVAKPDIPPARTVSRKPNPLPRSFRPHVIVNSDYDATGLAAPKSHVEKPPATVIANSYVVENVPSGVGKVEEIEVGEHYAGVGQNVFLHLKRPFSSGDRLGIVFSKGHLDEKLSLPFVMEVQGSVEINEVVDANQNIYRASVINCLNPIQVDAVVLNEDLPRVSTKREGAKSSAKVRIIGGELDVSRRVLGEGAFIYLDGGLSSGIHEGDLLAVDSERIVQREDSKIPNYRRSTGVIKIVHAENKVATAYVLESNTELKIGDSTGGHFPVGESLKHVAPVPGSPVGHLAPSASSGGDGDLDLM
jgi:hypothetical protein